MGVPKLNCSVVFTPGTIFLSGEFDGILQEWVGFALMATGVA